MRPPWENFVGLKKCCEKLSLEFSGEWQMHQGSWRTASPFGSCGALRLEARLWILVSQESVEALAAIAGVMRAGEPSG